MKLSKLRGGVLFPIFLVLALFVASIVSCEQNGGAAPTGFIMEPVMVMLKNDSEYDNTIFVTVDAVEYNFYDHCSNKAPSYTVDVEKIKTCLTDDYGFTLKDGNIYTNASQPEIDEKGNPHGDYTFSSPATTGTKISNKSRFGYGYFLFAYVTDETFPVETYCLVYDKDGMENGMSPGFGVVLPKKYNKALFDKIMNSNLSVMFSSGSGENLPDKNEGYPLSKVFLEDNDTPTTLVEDETDLQGMENMHILLNKTFKELGYYWWHVFIFESTEEMQNYGPMSSGTGGSQSDDKKSTYTIKEIMKDYYKYFNISAIYKVNVKREGPYGVTSVPTSADCVLCSSDSEKIPAYTYLAVIAERM